MPPTLGDPLCSRAWPQPSCPAHVGGPVQISTACAINLGSWHTPGMIPGVHAVSACMGLLRMACLTPACAAGACEGSLACSTCHIIVEVRLPPHACMPLPCIPGALLRVAICMVPQQTSTKLTALHGERCHWRPSRPYVHAVPPFGPMFVSAHLPACPQNPEYFKRMPEVHEDELDMLDLAFGLTET